MSEPKSTSIKRKRLPEWLKTSCKGGRARGEVRGLLKGLNLNTVCESAKCPNLYECWANRTATFMILGNSCTRNCKYCAVAHAQTVAPDPNEPLNIAKAVTELNLNFVVLTSVTRDDLADGGASHFAKVLQEINHANPTAGIEVLTPDFQGDFQALHTVLDAKPTVFNHNIETCRRLTPAVRPQADYDLSLKVLAESARYGGKNMAIKSGLMVGIGESDDEIRQILIDLKKAGVQIVTIGQYLPPSSNHWALDRYVTPAEFAEWERIAKEEIGFEYVISAPLVRSSYKAEEAARSCLTN